MKKIVVFGSTGSIGRSTLEVVKRYPDRFKVEGLACRKNVKLLKKQVEAFKPKAVYVAEGKLDHPRCFSGDSWRAFLEELEFDLFVSASMGSSGFLPTVEALKAGKSVALANKETLIMGGRLISPFRERIVPVDSEHSSVFRLLRCVKKELVSNIYLTASGGPFIDRKDMKNVTPEEAVRHPNWPMGRKISVDSATLMNKGLEVIEASYLFDIPGDRIKVVIHRQSFTHALLELIDGTLLSHIYKPDMKIPISFALFFPDPPPLITKTNIYNTTFTFEEVDGKRFPAVELCYRALSQDGMPIVLNAANEVAVESFLERKIAFDRIVDVVEEVMNRLSVSPPSSFEEVVEIDRVARLEAKKVVERWRKRS